MTAKETFMSVDNLKLCIDVFSNYMQNRYGFDVVNSKTNPKKVLYELMTSVNDKYVHVDRVTLKDMNNIVLNSARDFYIKANSLVAMAAEQVAAAAKAPTATTKAATHLGYVARPERTDRPVDADKDFKALEDERNAMFAKPQETNDNIQKPYTENAFDASEFDKRLSQLRTMRGDVNNTITTERLQQDAANKITIESFHPKSLFEDIETSKRQERHHEPSHHSVEQKEFVVAPTSKTYCVDRYMSVNGFDRDWFKHKHRFQLVADFSSYAENDLQNRYRNITSICIKRVIIPQEIVEEDCFGARPRTHYIHPMSFTFPYVLVTIDEIADMYDGTNDNVRRTFCKMIVDKQFCAKNGRGFLVLQTMQDEKKTFYPTPLSRLSRLTISIRKPNGELFNQSRDSYRVTTLEYESFNPQHLKVVLDKYFDRNEFFKGDMIKMQGDTLTHATTREFINRQTGHEIMEMGQPNEQGFFKTFYINAPGSFDEENGLYTIDKATCESIDANTNSGEPCIANIMNMSLQCVVAMKMEQMVADPGRLALTV
jgi:hypothetical protein